jgi:hypothetical protein
MVACRFAQGGLRKRLEDEPKDVKKVDMVICRNESEAHLNGKDARYIRGSNQRARTNVINKK